MSSDSLPTVSHRFPARMSAFSLSSETSFPYTSCGMSDELTFPFSFLMRFHTILLGVSAVKDSQNFLQEALLCLLMVSLALAANLLNSMIFSTILKLNLH